ncbi:MAG: PEP-CTERM sorting domain-containing protein [Desmonostoc vinosum HA7617-LM4]|nr:PEP-CTERM sorting domain-containing protein [Desmonostoc vinosum HA7617-LM4]
MFSTALLKRLTQATATAAVGVAMFAAVGNAPASAVTLKTYNLAGTFAPEALPASTGLSTDLGGGSLEGTFTLDKDADPSSSLKSWTVKLLNSSGDLVKTFSNSLPDVFSTGSLVSNSLRFGDVSTAGGALQSANLGLQFQEGFSGTGTGAGFFSYNSYSFSTGASTAGAIALASVTSSASGEPVPEPFTIGGTAVAGAMGFWLKRKKQASKTA